MKRKTSQHLIPLKAESNTNAYNIYPTHPIVNGNIAVGYPKLATALNPHNIILIEGYMGVDWQEIVTQLKVQFENQSISTEFIDMQSFMKSEAEINTMVTPFLGGDDPIFGTKTNLSLIDYFNTDKLALIQPNSQKTKTIIYGVGASLAPIKGCLVYIDVPKNELQFRMRANQITNLGFSTTKDPKQMYKHFYFVDWVITNSTKKALLPKIDIFIDQQRPSVPTFTTGNALRASLKNISQSYFRVRPWFEPGVWGGQWIKEHIGSLNQEVPNYAWSFEMIVPENGILFSDANGMLEISFDALMFQEQHHVLGKAAQRFKDEFPIRFDFLDTFDGGNLSVQCHPKPEYIKTHFGENFTQDETYYILDAKPEAKVYLGFQEDINPDAFKTALEHSFKTKSILDVEKYVQILPAKKHDLFLIPHGTIHCSGDNNMVLEISATPYIFTFKMYDWQRLDMDGNPRPLNIDRAFSNLNFNRKGNVVNETLISKPEIISSDNNSKIIHLPTHPDHFYDIYRYEFKSEITIKTNQQCHILMLVEGTQIELQTAQHSQQFHYAETFAVAAAANSYTLINKGREIAKVIVSFVKDSAC